jgi:hypothetical protein
MRRYWKAWAGAAAVAGVLFLAMAAARAAAAPEREGPPKAEVERLLKEAHDLEEAGKSEQAAALRERAERLAVEAEQARRPGEPAPGPAPLGKRIAALREAARIAEAEGMPAIAGELRARAEALERELPERAPEKEGGRAAEGARLRAEAATRRAMAERSQKEGREREAAELRAEAERLEARAREVRREGKPESSIGELARRQEELRGEVARLREEVGALRREVEQLRARQGKQEA